ncbi:MAG: DUF763 domain-containing protein, partial [Candidatus Hadarchaeales archaeon]
MRTGIAELPLHGGKCPPWLFSMMKKLGGEISALIIKEYGRKEFLHRLGDPFFFQALGCVLGYDWHSSGLTTVTMGALKEGIPKDLGIAVCGGKGKISKKTPDEIERVAESFGYSSQEIERLKYASRMAAKVDNACIQDGYQLYHHCFVLSEDGEWAVVQQGMHERLARRYHWLSERVRSFVDEPHSGIAGDRMEAVVLDMTAKESEEARKVSVDLVNEKPQHFLSVFREAGQRTIDEFSEGKSPEMKLKMPTGHMITKLSPRTLTALKRAYEIRPENYEELVGIRGIGPAAIRALALVSEIVYGAPPSWRDPVKYSFAHGGKDGIPFPVDQKVYHQTIEFMEEAIWGASIGKDEKIR